jgi:hypothetical protein
MNFYDEAIETKHSYLKYLQGKARELRKITSKESFKLLESTRSGEPFPIEQLYDQNIAALLQAESYFWEPRVTQLAMASGQQLPESVKYQRSWLPSNAGWWWFGRSSPLIGVSKEGDRKYCHALLYSVEGNSVHVNTHTIEGTSMIPLGSFVWRESESLGELLGKIQAAIVGGLNTTYTIKIQEIIKDGINALSRDRQKLDHLKARIGQIDLAKKQLETVLSEEGSEG